MSTSDDDFDPSKSLSAEFDFDYWKDLYEQDPENFEKNRTKLMEALVESTPEERRHRAEGLLFRIDAVRRNMNTPMKNCIEISNMMWGSFYKLNDALHDISSVAKGGSKISDTNNNNSEEHNADILEFKPNPE